MMNIDMDWIYYLLLGSNALLAGAAVLAIFRAERLVNQQRSFWSSPTGTALHMRTAPDELLRAIERRIQALTDSIDRPASEEKPGSPEPRIVPYENAVRMAKLGATMDDLTRTCGLSPSEARLLMQVHGARPQVAKAS